MTGRPTPLGHTPGSRRARQSASAPQATACNFVAPPEQLISQVMCGSTRSPGAMSTCSSPRGPGAVSTCASPRGPGAMSTCGSPRSPAAMSTFKTQEGLSEAGYVRPVQPRVNDTSSFESLVAAVEEARCGMKSGGSCSRGSSGGNSGRGRGHVSSGSGSSSSNGNGYGSRSGSSSNCPVHVTISPACCSTKRSAVCSPLSKSCCRA